MDPSDNDFNMENKESRLRETSRSSATGQVHELEFGREIGNLHPAEIARVKISIAGAHGRAFGLEAAGVLFAEERLNSRQLQTVRQLRNAQTCRCFGLLCKVFEKGMQLLRLREVGKVECVQRDCRLCFLVDAVRQRLDEWRTNVMFCRFRSRFFW